MPQLSKYSILRFMAMLFVTNLVSQTNPTKYTFENIEKGATQRAISSIVQDNRGLIWMGTNGVGLYKYNGVDYLSYKQIGNDPTTINSSLVHALYVDSSGRLWIGTEAGLNLYDHMLDQFEEIKLVPEISTKGRIPVYAIAENEEGELLIGTHENGLFKLNPGTLVCSRISLSESYKSLDILVNCIVKDKEGNMLVGSNMGLFTYTNGDSHLKKAQYQTLDGIASISERIDCVLEDKDGNLWVGTFSDGLIKIQSEPNNLKSFHNLKITEKRILSLIQGPDGNILCSAENDGLFVLDTKGGVIDNYLHSKSDVKSIKSNSIWSLFVDNQERIWIGYYNKGVGVYDKYYDKFLDIESLPDVENSLQSTSVTGMVSDDKGNIWIGMDGGGVDIYNLKNRSFVHLGNPNNGLISGLASTDVQAVYIDSKDNIWVGTWSSGIFFLGKGSDAFVPYNTTNANGGLTSNSITSFSEDSSGTIWIGTFFNGLHSYNPTSKKFTPHKGQPFNKALIGESNIRKVLVDKGDDIWLGTTKGLYKVIRASSGNLSVESLNEKMFNTSEEISTTIILSLFEDQNQDIWIGTDGSGLCKYERENDLFVWYTKKNGLVQESITSIIADDNGNIWLGGEAGISQLEIANGTFSNFTTNDGLLANDFNYNSVFKGENGVLYFGSYEGINYFEPTKILLNKNEPSLYFSDFRLFNKSVTPGAKESPLKKVISETEHLTLNHRESVFTIEFAGINYTRSQNNQYAYYLEGFENTWNYVGNNRNATYTNLSPGDYIFKVKAANNDGVWNESPITMGITVLPPWWLTKIAILSYFALFALIAFFISKFVSQRIKGKRIIKFERDKRQQEEILNTKKIQFFTNISHEFRTPLTLILNPLRDIIENNRIQLSEDVRNKHKIILKNTNRLMRLINELMDFRKLHLNKMTLNVSKIDAFPFIEEVSSHFEEEASDKNIMFSVESDGTPIDLWGDPSMLEKIVFNMLSNAFKATPENGAITVGIHNYTKPIVLPLTNKSEPISAIEIVIEDTGSGIKKEEVDRIFERFYQSKEMNSQYYGASGTGIGLEVVQNFVSLHKGIIKVKSNKGSGTIFKIFLPNGKDHFQDSEMVLFENKEIRQEDNFVLLADDTKAPSSTEIIERKLMVEGKRKTLLIVEDNKGLRDYLKGELEMHYQIIEAENGKKGLDRANNGIPDIIITDVIMPEMDGFEFCTKIKNDIKTSHIPVLMLTAKTMTDDRVKGIDSGADAYLSKPFEMKVLRSYLKRLVDSRQIFFDKYHKGTNHITLPENTTRLDKSFITRVLDYIDKNIGEADLNVEHLADDMHLSRSQLYRKIKAMTGMTANEFIRKIRLEKAKLMIENGGQSISEVGFKVGFSSPSYFTKCFKSHFGILPTELKSD